MTRAYPETVLELDRIQRRHDEIVKRTTLHTTIAPRTAGWESQPKRQRPVRRLPVISLHDLKEPPPPIWTVRDLIPEGHITVLYGAGGVAKSYLALAIATCIAADRPFAGLPVKQGRVLYIDFEMNQEEQVRRAYQVARGLDLIRPPKQLDYFNPGQSESDVFSIYDVAAALKGHQYSLIILDSVGAALRGDMESARDIVPIFQALKPLGTVLPIDHQPKTRTGENYKDQSLFGSVFKTNLARSVWQLERRKPDERTGTPLTLRHKKANVSKLLDPIGLRVEFGRCFSVGIDDVTPDEEDRAPIAREKVCESLDILGPATVKEVAAATELSESTIRSSLAELGHQGLVEIVGKNGQAKIYTLADKAADETIT